MYSISFCFDRKGRFRTLREPCGLFLRTATLCCALLLPCPALAMEVTPLADRVDTPHPADLLRTDPYPQAPYMVPQPAWTTGNLMPLDEWETLSRRPSAFVPRPVPLPRGVYPGMHAIAGSHGAIIPVSQFLQPRTTGPDPAAMPVQTSPQRPRASRSASSGPQMTSTTTTVTGQGVTPPTVASPTAPSRPTAAQPSVPQPVAPAVASPASPAAPAGTTAATPNTVQNPYSTTAPSPTGPITPASPTVNTPSTPAGAEARGGMGTANRPTTQPATATPQPGASAVTAPVGSGAPATANGTGNGAMTGTLRTTPDEVPRQRPPVLSGPAESLVIPPSGISLSPNNGAGALTSPSVPQ